MEAIKKEVNEAIKVATGYDVTLYESGGFCHFSANDVTSEEALSKLPITRIVGSLGMFSIVDWVDEFIGLFDE